MSKPLADLVRPNTFDKVLGNKRIINILKKLIQENKMVSLILYGSTGIGKTTIANIISNHYPLNHFKFNASADSKSLLKQIINSAKLYGNVLLIVDEIHRMNRDIQDYLLPYVEKGDIIMIGLTTENPYISVNPAIRSRVSIFRIERPNKTEIVEFLKDIDLSIFNKNIQITDDVYNNIAVACNGEVRTAINMLELLILTTSNNEIINKDNMDDFLPEAAKSSFKTGDNYYDVLSAFHKSVRGSDVNASLHYLSRLIEASDLKSLCRRLRAIVYEDIGLANPLMGVKVDSACNTALQLGLPEAINALGAITIEMCLSPKSNSAHLAINNAIKDVSNGLSYQVPYHLINNPTYTNKKKYKYAHDYKQHIIKQDYLPDKLKGRKYYIPQNHSKFEKAFSEEYEKIENILKNGK